MNWYSFEIGLCVLSVRLLAIRVWSLAACERYAIIIAYIVRSAYRTRVFVYVCTTFDILKDYINGEPLLVGTYCR